MSSHDLVTCRVYLQIRRESLRRGEQFGIVRQRGGFLCSPTALRFDTDGLGLTRDKKSLRVTQRDRPDVGRNASSGGDAR